MFILYRDKAKKRNETEEAQRLLDETDGEDGNKSES